MARQHDHDHGPGNERVTRLEDVVKDTYTPKTNPDTIRDYIGTWADINEHDYQLVAQRVDEIPAPELDNLPILLDMLAKHVSLARENPGRFIPGNTVLGAPENDYVPSLDELLASEVGNTIHEVITRCSQAELERIKNASGITGRTLLFNPIIVHHVDVMGSGRFFHAVKGAPLPVQL